MNLKKFLISYNFFNENNALIGILPILESGFVQAFIEEYYEYYFYGFYSDKDRLSYSLCLSDKAKHEVTLENIRDVQKKITLSGFEELSSEYLNSSQVTSGPNYIKGSENRLKFWIQRFAEYFEEDTDTFVPVKYVLSDLKEEDHLTKKDFKDEKLLWYQFSKDLLPKIQDLELNFRTEINLLLSIQQCIEDYNENEYWSFDFEYFKSIADYVKPIENLVCLSDLVVQINRLEMFKGFLKIDKTRLVPQKPNDEDGVVKYSAKHYALSFLVECNAKGKSVPLGQKKLLENIGNKKIGVGKGNRFYKVFNEIVKKDINAAKDLIEIGGENWRTIVIDLSDEPDLVEKYLQSKQL